jgi:hypothetical protein
MGHYASEMNLRTKFQTRLGKLQDKLENIKLSEFTVGDLESLSRVMIDTCDVTSTPRESDVEYLEKRIKELGL